MEMCAVPYRLKSPKMCSGETSWQRKYIMSRQDGCLDKFDGIEKSSQMRKLSCFRTK